MPRLIHRISPQAAPRLEVEGGTAERVIELARPAEFPELAPPVVHAVRRDGLLWFWCEWCQHRHCHGGTGHRVAHCWNPASPYRITGYIVTEVAR